MDIITKIPFAQLTANGDECFVSAMWPTGLLGAHYVLQRFRVAGGYASCDGGEVIGCTMPLGAALLCNAVFNWDTVEKFFHALKEQRLSYQNAPYSNADQI